MTDAQLHLHPQRSTTRVYHSPDTLTPGNLRIHNICMSRFYPFIVVVEAFTRENVVSRRFRSHGATFRYYDMPRLRARQVLSSSHVYLIHLVS